MVSQGKLSTTVQREVCHGYGLVVWGFATLILEGIWETTPGTPPNCQSVCKTFLYLDQLDVTFRSYPWVGLNGKRNHFLESPCKKVILCFGPSRLFSAYWPRVCFRMTQQSLTQLTTKYRDAKAQVLLLNARRLRFALGGGGGFGKKEEEKRRRVSRAPHFREPLPVILRIVS